MSFSSHDTYRPFMIQSCPSTETITATTQHHHTPRKKPSRPSLPSAVLSYDDRATWWSTQEYQKTDISCSSLDHGHTHSRITWQPAFDEEYEEALRSECGSVYMARHDNHDNDDRCYSEQSHTSNSSTEVLHHYDRKTKTSKEEDTDLKQLWDVAESVLTRPASTYSYSVDMSSARLEQSTCKQPERRQRIVFGWNRMGKPPLSAHAPEQNDVDRSEQAFDPESIAEGIVECTDVGKRASTATALTWRGFLPSPRQTEVMPKSSSMGKSFSDSEQVQEPKTRCRWWVILLCIFILLAGVTCIVLGCVLFRKGGKWNHLVS